ncbi:hypothetical protein PALS2_221 [Staphylococcus phage PALS_2]|nr:hypothetical protein PALS2_221 [Staphylococcus phage PALS_2]
MNKKKLWIMTGITFLTSFTINFIILYYKDKYRQDDIDTSEDPFMKGPLFI